MSELPRRPARPDLDAPPPKRNTWLGVVFALSLGLVLMAGLVFLSMVWLGAVIVIVVGIALVLFHYVTWGWWMPRVLGEADKEENDWRRAPDKKIERQGDKERY